MKLLTAFQKRGILSGHALESTQVVGAQRMDVRVPGGPSAGAYPDHREAEGAPWKLSPS